MLDSQKLVGPDPCNPCCGGAYGIRKGIRSPKLGRLRAVVKQQFALCSHAQMPNFQSLGVMSRSQMLNSI